MAEVVLFHHAQGLTSGVLAFADRLRQAGHRVHTPDCYEGRTFATLDEGLSFARESGFDTVQERGRRAAEALPPEVVYGGFSLGGMAAQMLAQTRPGAQGLLLLHTAIPLEEFGGTWPPGLPAQIHTMEDDDWGDVDIARELAAAVETLELFVYPGDRHLFTDASLSEHDPAAAALVMERVLAFLDPL
jgi:dienelactone hydrolase